MYTPAAFRETELPALHDTLRAARLATLVTATQGGMLATHLPLFLVPEEGPFGTLYGHIARANTQWDQPPQGDALVMFMGADAYISPSFYPSKAEHGKVVPTWNYVAVHAHGPIEFFQDEARLLDVVTKLTTLHETGRADPWAVSDAPEAFIRAQLRGIVGLRLQIARLEGKRKMSQNRNEADRAGVAAGLAASPDHGDQQAAGLIPQ